jgi:RNA polymerase sigma-70 factor (ECF subfamily)
MSDAVDIRKFKEGNIEVFKTVFEVYHQRLHSFALSIIGEKEAEDVVQDTFIKLWERRSSFDNLYALKVFLYLTVKNACLNILRHQKVVQDHEKKMPVDQEQDLLHKMIKTEVIGEVRLALAQLPESYRRVIYLSYFEDKGNQEAAELLNISINTVKTQKLRGFKILRTILRHSPEGLFILLYKLL